uniref:Uncharacterized protein n=1 Tax=Leersia perrieri TaxID=77586 RepID=A0A0D9VDL9_9ORYZ
MDRVVAGRSMPAPATRASFLASAASFLTFFPRQRTALRTVPHVSMAAAGYSMAGAGGEEKAAARRRGIDRQAVDRGIAYVLMVVALVTTYALH